MPPGFLIVFSEPGELVSLAEFQGLSIEISTLGQLLIVYYLDWYNNEHVPLRMNHLPSFLTGARFTATDALKPSWAALYDVDDTLTFQHESYTRLRANRSPREANLVVRLEILDRRTCELVSDSGESEVTSSLASKNPSKGLVTHGVNVNGETDFDGWTKDIFQRLRGVRGWVRSRTFMCIDNLKTGTAVAGKGPEEQIVSKYIVVHGQWRSRRLEVFAKRLIEFESTSHVESPGFTNIIRTSDSGVEIVEVRNWDLYRAYPGVAQGNVGS